MTQGTRARAVLEVLAGVGAWETFVGPTGARLYRLPTHTGRGWYTVSPTSCTCPADQYRRDRRACKHVQALVLALGIRRALARLQGGERGVEPAHEPAEPTAAAAAHRRARG